ncbi:uncharacterized protein N7477_002028 [Penicillium maclennaniae]|uniref:uncharacterized protein n=1 Tax=Penicillium maclennaniae TaxID=1343394 RepID=UPI00254152DB|nr:uncharacterized protein N7477_002028 [Penicillium maclennaniae]KAJ5682088.1 hypothetical protein N7477_002028 [Penicillium maclennaniae]
MHFTAFSTVLLALAQYACAVPVESNQASGLDVTLRQVDHTRIKAVVKNAGNEEVTFVHLNFFRDSAPVKKVAVYKDDAEVAFEGIKRRLKLEGLTPEALTTLAVGETVEDEFDVAATSDLSHGGPMLVRSNGLVPLVNNGSVSGYLPYHSNELKLEVDAIMASRVTKAINPLARRTKESCSNSSGRLLSREHLKIPRLWLMPPPKPPSPDQPRNSRTKEAQSTSSGSTTYYCTDVYGYCETNVLAYTLPSLNAIANCDIYYSYLPSLASTCHEQDQATTTLHEFTHAPGVYSPGTEDLGYGYSAASSLSSSQAVLNADSYALYANGT